MLPVSLSCRRCGLRKKGIEAMEMILIVGCAVAVVSTAITVFGVAERDANVSQFDWTKTALCWEVERARWERAI
jgi:hypothetical protein